MEQEFYKSRLTFILFALASVIGLGGIWRFSYVVGTNGGGSFLIIYLICLFAIGIPLVIAELALGGKTGRSSPLAFKEIRGKAEWMGWLQIINLIIIWFYYAVLVGWCLSYIFFSLKGSYFGVNSESFFGSYLGSFVPLIAAFIVWLLSFSILSGGIKKHEKFTLMTLPLTWIFLLILAVRSITLPGAAQGLEFFLKPEFSRMANFKTWATAMGQLFFALNIATASLPVFSRCLKKTEIANSGFIISLGDIAFAFLAGIVIFPAVFAFGFEPTAGTKLAFITLPALITKMPLGQFFGVIFFTLLMLSGWDSITTVFETHLQAINEKTNVSRKKIALFLCLLGFVGSAVIAIGFMKGKDFITPLDTVFGTYGLLVLGLIEVIFFGWIWGADKIREFINEHSDFKIGKWFEFCLKIICPVAILIVISALIIG